jgi:glycosyltransferase involved in cell wall biosynthesis
MSEALAAVPPERRFASRTCVPSGISVSSVLTVVGGYRGSRTTGASRMAWRTAAALCESGHEVALITDTSCPADLADCHWLVFHSPGQFRTSSRAQPDVVHVYDLASPEYAELGYGLFAEFGAALLLTPASAPVTWPDPCMGHRLCAAAATVFVLSAVEARQIESLGVPRQRISRIPQAPDLTGTGNGTAFRARHKVDGQLVLFLGRRVRAKGFELLLDAASQVWELRPRTVFAFGGPDDSTEAAEVFARHRDDRILDLGELTDTAKHDALAACDLLCLPSSADVFPLVFAEAWSCGKPVISGWFDGADEVVRDGVDGLVCELSSGHLAAALLRLLADSALCRRLGAAGMDRVRAGMTWPSVAATVESRFPTVSTARCGSPPGGPVLSSASTMGPLVRQWHGTGPVSVQRGGSRTNSRDDDQLPRGRSTPG